jgi:hypothetical protein
MPRARHLAAAAGHLIEFLAEFCDQRVHRLGVAGEIGGVGIDRGMERHGNFDNLGRKAIS